MTAYRATDDIPPLRAAAMRLARNLAFDHSCSPEVGRLLRLLASQVTEGIIGEVGSGVGVGTAWLASGLRAGARLVSVESQPCRATTVHELFANNQQVAIHHDDWRTILPYGPFSLLCVDARPAKHDAPDEILASIRPGGTVVLDDLTPEDQWPTEWKGQADPVRAFWLNDPRLIATQLLVRSDAAVILATRHQG